MRQKFAYSSIPRVPLKIRAKKTSDPADQTEGAQEVRPITMLVGSQSNVTSRKARSVSVWARERKQSQFLEPLSQRIYDATKQEGANIIGIVTATQQEYKHSDPTGRLRDAKAALDRHIDKFDLFGKSVQNSGEFPEGPPFSNSARSGASSGQRTV